MARVRVPTLVLGITSDMLYPIYQQRQIHQLLARHGTPTELVEIDSPHGHDAFLINLDQVAEPIGTFLDEGAKRRCKTNRAPPPRPGTTGPRSTHRPMPTRWPSPPAGPTPGGHSGRCCTPARSGRSTASRSTAPWPRRPGPIASTAATPTRPSPPSRKPSPSSRA